MRYTLEELQEQYDNALLERAITNRVYDNLFDGYTKILNGQVNLEPRELAAIGLELDNCLNDGTITQQARDAINKVDVLEEKINELMLEQKRVRTLKFSDDMTDEEILALARKA